MGSITKDSSIRGSGPKWKDTFSIDEKGGYIYHIKDRNAWRKSTEASFQRERWSQGEHE
jgi:hypothetical protein